MRKFLVATIPTSVALAAGWNTISATAYAVAHGPLVQLAVAYPIGRF